MKTLADIALYAHAVVFNKSDYFNGKRNTNHYEQLLGTLQHPHCQMFPSAASNE